MLWGTSLPSDARRAEGDRPVNPRHDEEENCRRQDLHLDKTAVSSPGSSEPGELYGTWGERNAGRLGERMVMEDLEALRCNLTSLSKTRSGAYTG